MHWSQRAQRTLRSRNRWGCAGTAAQTSAAALASRRRRRRRRRNTSAYDSVRQPQRPRSGARARRLQQLAQMLCWQSHSRATRLAGCGRRRGRKRDCAARAARAGRRTCAAPTPLVETGSAAHFQVGRALPRRKSGAGLNAKQARFLPPFVRSTAPTADTKVEEVPVAADAPAVTAEEVAKPVEAQQPGDAVAGAQPCRA